MTEVSSPRTKNVVRIMAVAGSSASGKDHCTDMIRKEIDVLAEEYGIEGPISFHIIPSDMFYKDLDEEQHALAMKDMYNFDEPKAIDGESLVKTVKQFSDLNATEAALPVYDFVKHCRTGSTMVPLNKNDKRRIIVVQGIFALCFPELRDLANFKIFLQTDVDVQVLRRIERDTTERGRDVAGVIKQYRTWVKPGYENWISPTRKFADLEFPYNETNHKIVETLALQLLLGKR